MDRLFTASWHRLWTGLGAAGTGHAARDEVFARHAEPWRRYHTQQHLQECLAAFDAARALALCPAEVEAGLWFHDAVYDLQRSDNEEQSALLARRVLAQAGVAPEAITRVEVLVLATRHTAAPTEPDEQLLVDIDLAILGADEARFAEYEAQIRQEYASVPEPVFREKRRAILQSFLARPRLYGTAHLRQLLEQRARLNLARAVAAGARA